MKTFSSSALFALLLGSACDLEPGSIGDESESGDSQKNDDPAGDDCPCAASEICVLPTGSCEPTTDAPGSCEPMPDACATIFAPVCGCDGATYPNECDAMVNGVNVLHDGECEGGTSGTTGSGTTGDDPSTSGGDDTGGSDTSDPTGGEDTEGGAQCDGFAGFVCPDGQFCHHEPGVCIMIADALGECWPIPDACAQILDPVCGCDGITYDSECHAQLAGVSVASTGTCGDQTACVGTGGVWVQNSCGHYDCGTPPPCAAVIPGCDCGAEANFEPGVGCVADPACP